MIMSGSRGGRSNSIIDKRDFDANRPLLRDIRSNKGGGGDGRGQTEGGPSYSQHKSRRSRLSADDRNEDGHGNDGLLSDVVEGIVERDRRKIERHVMKACSFVWGVITCLGAGSITAFSLYGPLLLTRLHYTQLRVNAVAIAAEVSMYLPVPLFGYLCDRYTPSPLSFASAFFFGGGYLLAAYTYRSGPPLDAGGQGWPFWVMITAFILVGAGTSCMYLAAVATCAKNFGRGKYKGIMLAVPIAAFGLSGMWQSQVGTYLLCERSEDGKCGDVDVFRYFLFLSVLLLGIGLIGTFALRIVDEEEEKYIDEAVDELEQSGILGENDFFRPRDEVQAAYGTFDGPSGNDDEGQSIMLPDEESDARRREKEREEEERRKKNWLLNFETRLFLKDHTMWWLAGGFLLITGPGEAYINNLGTIIQTLTPRNYLPTSPPPTGLPSTHVSTIALTSTIARLLTGSLSDIFAPTAAHHFKTNNPEEENTQFPPPEEGEAAATTGQEENSHLTVSRLTFLLPSAFLLSLGFLLLSSSIPLQHPQLFHATTALVGFGYGSAFSLVPIIINVVWGVENFATNWGIVAMFPAVGAAVWGVLYSSGYQDAIDDNYDAERCFGWRCYGFWAVGCFVSVCVAMLAWTLAWRGWKKRGVVV